MLFSEALELLKKGDVLHRESWSLQDGYLCFMKGMKHIWKIILEPQPNAGNYIFSVEDLEANDWKLFEIPSQVSEVVEVVPEVVA